MTAEVPVRESKARRRGPRLSGSGILAAATVLLAVIAAFTVPAFASVANVRGLFLAVSLIGIVAVGLSLVTIVGKVFSLSIPALIALCTITFATAMHLGSGLALLLSIALGTVAGLVQGFIVGRLETDPIITTIAAAAIMVGVGQFWTDGRTIVGHGDTKFLNGNILGFIPFQTLVFALLTAALAWWHRYTVTGRKLTLVGLNQRAAHVSGLKSSPVVILAFTVSGATTGVAAGLLSAQSGQGTLLLGASFGFDAIVAVVIGGVGIKGGFGTPLGAAIGALFVGLLENILSLMGLSYQHQLVSKGVLVLLAVTGMGVSAARRESS